MRMIDAIIHIALWIVAYPIMEFASYTPFPTLKTDAIAERFPWRPAVFLPAFFYIAVGWF
jgi:hypothetical protein